VHWRGQRYAVDTGFIVFNDWTYPNFIRLLGHWGGLAAHEMSFSVHDPRTGWNTTATPRQPVRPAAQPAVAGFWGMLRDILRFNRQALADLDNSASKPHHAGRLPATQRYGQRFIDHYIVPMGSAIWSMSQPTCWLPAAVLRALFATTACCRSTTARNGG
jgi:predicted NAD/FAD-binding protein